MSRMGSTVLVAVVMIFAVVEAARIRRESDDCDKITLAHEECVKLAYDNYVAAHGAGDDGRGDWEARKSCNYVNSAVGECGDVLSGCYAEDEVTARKDHQVEAILNQLEKMVGGWDSSKCPVVSEYLERQGGDDEDGEEAADDENTMYSHQADGDQADEEGDEDGGEDGEEEEEAADGEPSEDDAQEEDGDEGDEEVNGEEGDGEEADAEEGVAEEGEAEEGDGGDGEDEEGDESEDGEEGDADAEDDEEDEDAEDGGEDEDEDDESSSPILISSFTMVLACLLAA